MEMRADVALPHFSQSSMDVQWSFFSTPCPGVLIFCNI